jgi:hypothetical protein
MAESGPERLGKALKIAKKLIRSLTKAPSHPGSLEKRLRPHAALVYSSFLHKKEKLERETPQEPNPQTFLDRLLALGKMVFSARNRLRKANARWQNWYREAMNSPAPKIAFNSACALASQNEEWAKVQLRLDAAIVDPDLKTYVPEDPELRAYASSNADAKAYLEKCVKDRTPIQLGK